MSLIGRIRTLRLLPRWLLAMLVLATLQTTLLPCAMSAQSAQMTEHCAYCPPADGDAAGFEKDHCAFMHAPTIDVQPANVSLGAPTSHCPPSYPDTFASQVLRQTKVFCPIILSAPPPGRALTLRHCVQLK